MPRPTSPARVTSATSRALGTGEGQAPPGGAGAGSGGPHSGTGRGGTVAGGTVARWAMTSVVTGHPDRDRHGHRYPDTPDRPSSRPECTGRRRSPRWISAAVAGPDRRSRIDEAGRVPGYAALPWSRRTRPPLVVRCSTWTAASRRPTLWSTGSSSSSSVSTPAARPRRPRRAVWPPSWPPCTACGSSIGRCTRPRWKAGPVPSSSGSSGASPAGTWSPGSWSRSRSTPRRSSSPRRPTTRSSGSRRRSRSCAARACAPSSRWWPPGSGSGATAWWLTVSPNCRPDWRGSPGARPTRARPTGTRCGR